MPEDFPLSQIGSFVPFPAILLDEQLPRLKDTEWRLICVVVRQTLGWQSGSGRKRRDWMSQRQLMARTGRNSAALSQALDSLVRKNLIECCDAGGNLLRTPEQRRQYRGRLYFSLSIAEGKPQPETMREPESEATLNHHLDGSAARIYEGWTNAAAIAQTRSYREKRSTKSE